MFKKINDFFHDNSDKLLHFTVTYILTHFLIMLNLFNIQSIFAFIVCLCIIKETLDIKHTGFSLADLLSGIFGSILFLGINII